MAIEGRSSDEARAREIHQGQESIHKLQTIGRICGGTDAPSSTIANSHLGGRVHMWHCVRDQVFFVIGAGISGTKGRRCVATLHTAASSLRMAAITATLPGLPAA